VCFKLGGYAIQCSRVWGASDIFGPPLISSLHGGLGLISRTISVKTQLHHFDHLCQEWQDQDVRTSLETSFLYRNTALGKLGNVVVCLANDFPIGRNIGDHPARPDYLRFRERFDIRMGGCTSRAAILEATVEINSP
jgi:hypothetical protein